MTRMRCEQAVVFGIGVLMIAAGFAPPADAAPPTEAEVVAAMNSASAFMLDTVSYRGGFVRLYTEDLKERWGEVPARETMVWVQDPGTVSVGRVLLEAYRATGDPAFLAHCRSTANALVEGQHPAGGWHYFMDSEPEGIEQWYRDVGTQCWGWEEYYHYYGNCTFDDNATTGAADFLLDLDAATDERTYRAPLLKALRFILDAQYPLGGWPQRFPIRSDRLSGDGPGYSACYTFNDGVTTNNIYLLLKAYETLGDEVYLEAARRGMYFVAIAQYGTPQAGWAQQYDMRLEPAAARSYEPAGLSPATTVSNLTHLMRFFKITGDTRFLRGIPAALEWLENCRLPTGHSDAGHTHAMFVEVGTGRPLYAHREGTSRQEGRYWVDYEPGNFPGHYGMQLRVDVDALRIEYDRVAALSPEEAKAEYEAAQTAAASPSAVEPGAVQQILDAMDGRGAWIEDLSAVDYADWKQRPRREFRGISTPTFTRNMRTLVNYVRCLRTSGSEPD